MGALYAKKQAKTAFHIEKIYGRNRFCLSKGILWFLLRSYIKSACAHARLSQNNSQVNPRVNSSLIQDLSYILYKTLHNTHCFARLFDLCYASMSVLAHLVKTYNIFSYYIFSYYIFPDSVHPLLLPVSQSVCTCYSITF